MRRAAGVKSCLDHRMPRHSPRLTATPMCMDRGTNSHNSAHNPCRLPLLAETGYGIVRAPAGFPLCPAQPVHTRWSQAGVSPDARKDQRHHHADHHCDDRGGIDTPIESALVVKPVDIRLLTSQHIIVDDQDRENWAQDYKVRLVNRLKPAADLSLTNSRGNVQDAASGR